MAKRNSDKKAYVSLLSEVVKTLKALKQYWFLAFFLVAVLSAATAGLFFKSSVEDAFLKVTYNYENATNGLLPNGAKLDTFMIMSDEVMRDVLDRARITDMSPGALSSLLAIAPLNSRSFNAANTASYYITTSYMVTIDDSEVLTKYRMTKRSMLNLIGQAYRDYFIKHYTDDGISIDFSQSIEDSMEYEEDYEFLNMCAKELLNYLKSKSNYANSFVSDNTGFSFPKIRQELTNLMNVSLPDCRAFILEHGVALNRSRYIAKIVFLLDDMKRNYEKGKNSFDIRGDVIDSYDGQMISTVLIPTEDKKEKFYMSKTQTGVDYLALDRSTSAINTSRLQREIDKNENIHSHMKSVSENTPEDTEKTRAFLASIRSELARLLTLTNQTNAEFNEQEAGEYLKTSISGNGLMAAIGGKKILAAGFVYVLIAILFVRRLSDRKEKHEKV
ncbi:MAG: hypothetical protein IKH57_23035 [Clostridia bacterium]|nr:hypothetical protein [Clostridia bacterium]